MSKRKILIERFWGKVDKSGECWEWIAHKSHNGYGIFWFDGKNVRAHRFVLSLYDVDIPDGMCALHHCDNPSCVNPDHLYVGSPQQNIRDMVKRGRQNKGEGHNLTSFTEDDVRKIRKTEGPHQEVAEMFGVTDATICKIKLRQTWAHVQ